MRGVAHPDVVAPGMAVVSSYSRYNQSMAVSNNWLTTLEQVDGTTYPYGINGGTSMSAPVVESNPIRWGSGKLNIQSFLQKAQAPHPLDLNADGEVNVGDVTYLITVIINEAPHPHTDINGDGATNVSDVSVLINHLLSAD